jgi:8-oxo-dGTP pyrophosphatase MutT (NUDIX family)
MSEIDETKSIDYYNRQPGIRTGGGVLIFNRSGDLLLVKPNYRNTWAWPGGGWDPGESPMQVATRECTEEIGRCPTPLLPAFINYIPPRDDGSLDVVHFVFTAELVDDDFINTLRPQDDEIDDIRFVPIPKLKDYMKPYRVRAVQTYLQHRVANAMLYLEDGLLPAA